jgi:uncharacterized membrane protein YeaQ/YmgE (transglycosylase-associated protein family)
MSIIIFLVFGLVVGALARFLVPGGERGGWGLSIVFGIIGAMAGGFIGQLVGIHREGQPAGFVLSVIGAMVVVAIYRAIVGRRALT